MEPSSRPVRFRITILAAALALLIPGCHGSDDEALAARSRRVFGPLPEEMPGSQNDSPGMVALGRDLFESTELSVNQTQSCESCHRLDTAGVDRLARSPGALGELGSRNTPTVLNAGFHKAQFWDGRANTLEEQASGPILNPLEMGMPSEEAVIERVRRSSLRSRFEEVFPAQDDPVTMENVVAALAAFQRTLISRGRFDAFQEGDLGALTADEKHGLQVFMESGCASCHGGPLLGGNIFQKLGIVNRYENDSDLGRATITNRDRDRFVFKVPSLRNVALTEPYFHDGAIRSLPDAVERMAWLQLGYEINESDRDAIVAFLESLTDQEASGISDTDSRLNSVEAQGPLQNRKE